MIRKIDHVGIAVESIAEARKVYEAMGLVVDEIEEVNEEGVRVAMMQCGESRIELIEATREDSPVARFLERRGPGLHHLCFTTDDIEDDQGRLRSSDMRLVREAPTRGAGGARVQFIHPASSGGVLIELSEPAGGSPNADGPDEG